MPGVGPGPGPESGVGKAANASRVSVPSVEDMTPPDETVYTSFPITSERSIGGVEPLTGSCATRPTSLIPVRSTW